MDGRGIVFKKGDIVKIKECCFIPRIPGYMGIVDGPCIRMEYICKYVYEVTVFAKRKETVVKVWGSDMEFIADGSNFKSEKETIEFIKCMDELRGDFSLDGHQLEIDFDLDCKYGDCEPALKL